MKINSFSLIIYNLVLLLRINIILYTKNTNFNLKLLTKNNYNHFLILFIKISSNFNLFIHLNL